MKNQDKWNLGKGDLVKVWFHGFDPEVGLISSYKKTSSGRGIVCFKSTTGTVYTIIETKMDDVSIKVLAKAKR